MKRLKSVVMKILIMVFVLAIPGVPTYLYCTGDSLQRATVWVFAVFGEDSWTEEDNQALENVQRFIGEIEIKIQDLRDENKRLFEELEWSQKAQVEYQEQQAQLIKWAIDNKKLDTLAYVKRAYGGRVRKAAKRFGVKEELLYAVISTEWDKRNLISKKGAKGLMGLMPRTAKMLKVDPDHEFENILGGAKYLAKLQKRFQTIELTIASYNAGPTVVAKIEDIPPYKETIDYVNRVKFLMALA